MTGFASIVSLCSCGGGGGEGEGEGERGGKKGKHRFGDIIEEYSGSLTLMTFFSFSALSSFPSSRLTMSESPL